MQEYGIISFKVFFTCHLINSIEIRRCFQLLIMNLFLRYIKYYSIKNFVIIERRFFIDKKQIALFLIFIHRSLFLNIDQ